MEKYFKSEKELLQGIIDRDGDCIFAVWCMQCPFMDQCVRLAVSDAKLLPKEERVRRAFDKLFNELMENELKDEETPADKETDTIHKDTRR